MRPNLIGVFPFHMTVVNTTPRWLSLTHAIPYVGASGFDFAMTIEATGGLATAIPAVGLCDAREDQMDAPASASGSATGTQGTTHHTFDLSTATDSYFAIVGVRAALSSGSIEGWIQGRISVMLKADAHFCGTRVIAVPPGLTTTIVKFPLGRVPAGSADKVRVALVGDDINDLDYRIYARGVNDPDAPAAWVALPTVAATFAEPTAAVCVADQSLSGITPANYHQLDIALGLALKAAGSNPSGNLRALAGVSYS